MERQFISKEVLNIASSLSDNLDSGSLHVSKTINGGKIEIDNNNNKTVYEPGKIKSSEKTVL